MTVDDRFTSLEPIGEEPEGLRSEIITGPVSDWATDFSHLEPEWAADPYPIQDDLRQRCPIAHTDRYGGAWLPTRHEDVAAIAYDTERFSSRAIIMGNFRPPRELAPIGGSPPISSDPPFHHARAQAAARRRSPRPRSPRTSRPPGRSATSSSTSSRAGTWSTRPPSTRSTSRCGSSPTCSASRRRTAPQFRGLRRGPARGHQPAAGRAHRRGWSACSATCSTRSTTTWSNPRDDLTSYLLGAEIDGQQARRRTTSPARWPCC